MIKSMRSKKLFSLILILVISVLLTGCGGNDLSTNTLEITKQGKGSILLNNEETSIPYKKEFKSNKQVSIKALSEENWIFDHWMGSGFDYSAKNNLNVTMDNNLKLKGNFSKLTYGEDFSNPESGWEKETYPSMNNSSQGYTDDGKYEIVVNDSSSMNKAIYCILPEDLQFPDNFTATIDAKLIEGKGYYGLNFNFADSKTLNAPYYLLRILNGSYFIAKKTGDRTSQKVVEWNEISNYNKNENNNIRLTNIGSKYLLYINNTLETTIKVEKDKNSVTMVSEVIRGDDESKHIKVHFDNFNIYSLDK